MSSTWRANHAYVWIVIGFSRAGDLYLGVAMGLYPNRRVMDAGFTVVHGGRQHALHASRLAPVERTETRVGPIAVEVVEAMRVLRVRVARNAHGLEADLLFRARTPAVEEPRYVRRFDGTNWNVVGVDAETPISDPFGWATFPSMVLVDGNPIVAWEQSPSFDDEATASRIFARRFDGSSWVEHNAGSATGSGINGSVEDQGLSVASAVSSPALISRIAMESGFSCGVVSTSGPTYSRRPSPSWL